MKNKHSAQLYNTLLTLSRNIFFYTKIGLGDNFENRINLMFIHFSILMIIYKIKEKKFSQSQYDSLFHCIENDLRELGLGDVSVNSKMKIFNKILYDILLKFGFYNSTEKKFKLNRDLICKYFILLKDPKSTRFEDFELYFVNFFNFCFEIELDYLVEESIKFTYGRT